MMQSKLLRFIESGKFYPVGSSKTEKVDVRIITATNRNLLEMVQEKTFRSDLYYRLHVLPIHIPALRDRPDDIEAISLYFVDHYNQNILNAPTCLRKIWNFFCIIPGRAMCGSYAMSSNVQF